MYLYNMCKNNFIYIHQIILHVYEKIIEHIISNNIIVFHCISLKYKVLLILSFNYLLYILKGKVHTNLNLEKKIFISFWSHKSL